MKKIISMLLLIVAALTVSISVASCGGEPNEPSEVVPPDTPSQDDNQEDYSQLLGYWLNEDESCMIEFVSDNPGCVVTTYIPRLEVNGKKYMSWESRYINASKSFTIIVFENAYSNPAIKVSIVKLTDDRMVLKKNDNLDYELTSYVFSRIDKEKHLSILEKGWNPCYLRSTGECNGHRYVDLGLSVKWAFGNLSGSKEPNPTDYGEYYAYGECDTKDSYFESNYKFDGYSVSDFYSNGIIDPLNNLIYEYDCASDLWGIEWRIPTSDEYTELINECEWKWISIDGVDGALVTGPSGNCIFLPASGGKVDGDSTDFNEGLRYGSSTLFQSGARDVLVWRNDGVPPQILRFILHAGYSVRPVTM